MSKKNILSENSEKIAISRYFEPGEDWESATHRVAKNIASVEKEKDNYTRAFHEILYNQDFLCAGRILRNAGHAKGSLINCFVLPIGDSIEEIGQYYKEALILWSEGGGVGCDFSPLRPKGDLIKQKGGKSSGLLSFLKAGDTVASTIESGGARRAAGLAGVDIYHPECMDVINAKLVDKEISHYNISIRINGEFLEAVETNSEWEFRFNQRNYHKMKAKEIWYKILDNMIKCAEPGLLNLDNLLKNNSYYYDPVSSCNPCHTGDTLVFVADGRGLVPFKQLAEEDADVPVFSYNDKTGKVEIKIMRRPRKSGKNKVILKVNLENGLFFKANEIHKVTLQNGKRIKINELKVGDSLHSLKENIFSINFPNKFVEIEKSNLEKKCEYCGTTFLTDQLSREKCFCSFPCYVNSKKENENSVESKEGIKVVSIETLEKEDVFNGTVDDNHNYYVFVGKEDINDKEKNLFFINSRNCGEAILEPHGICDLGSIVLPNFITGSVNTNWRKLEATIKLAVRFLDNVIDVNKYPLKEVDIKAHNSRRIGLGVLGLAEYLFAKQLRYGSKRANEEVERLMKFFRDCVYQSLVELASEKGAFPKFDAIPYLRASFIKKLPPKLRLDIKKYGTRCVTGMSIAPTGTISLLTSYTGGIEPLFAKAYRREDRVGERIYVHPLYKKLLENNEEIPEWFVDTSELKPEDHFEVQCAVQRYVDGAVSKTINMPKGSTTEQLDNLLLEYIKDLKGVTVYVDGSREGQILNIVSEKDAREYIKKEQTNSNLTEKDVSCISGKCEI